jgi:hypothetical protein
MKISKQEIERRMSRFNEVCRNSGVKLTHQRMEIFREVAQTGDHPEAESVYKGVRKRMPTISLDGLDVSSPTDTIRIEKSQVLKPGGLPHDPRQNKRLYKALQKTGKLLDLR